MTISLDTAVLEQGVQRLEGRLDAALFAASNLWAQNAQDYARSNAPWTDRTSNARNGLFGAANRDGPNYVITVYHTMPYGVWLEVRNSGRYAIIEPTIRNVGPQVMDHVRGLVGQL